METNARRLIAMVMVVLLLAMLSMSVMARQSDGDDLRNPNPPADRVVLKRLNIDCGYNCYTNRPPIPRPNPRPPRDRR